MDRIILPRIRAQRVDFHGYSDCIVLENDSTRVVLGAHCGGRVLEYSVHGKNALRLDPSQAGWTWKPGSPEIDPWGGRFDIGPEKTIPPHPTLWVGTWKSRLDSSGVAKLTSEADPATGMRLTRTFELAPDSTRLTCTQTMQNVSNRVQAWCHWGRTLSPGGGICIVPLTTPSRFPNAYLRYGPDPFINYLPSDPNVRIRENFLEIIGPPAHPKLGMDSHAGWLAYLTDNNLLFVKRFPTYPDRPYNEMAGFTVSVWYYKDELVELEPIGPMERLAPGESASFTEDWWLLAYPFPERRDALDLEEVSALVERTTIKTSSDRWLWRR